MAATYTLKGYNLGLNTSKSMISIWNGAGSTDILKINRIWLMNHQVGVAAVTGALVELHLKLITTHTTGTLLFPLKRISTSPNLHSAVVCSTGATVGESSLFRRIIWSGDEPTSSEYNMDTFGVIPNMNLVWDAGYVGSGIEPITLNASQGITLRCQSTVTVGVMDIMIEFTK